MKYTHGGKRSGAGRKKMGHIGLHLRLAPETLSQIDAIRKFYPQTKNKIVMMAVALKYEQIMHKPTHDRVVPNN